MDWAVIVTNSMYPEDDITHFNSSHSWGKRFTCHWQQEELELEQTWPWFVSTSDSPACRTHSWGRSRSGGWSRWWRGRCWWCGAPDQRRGQHCLQHLVTRTGWRLLRTYLSRLTHSYPRTSPSGSEGCCGCKGPETSSAWQNNYHLFLS